MCLETADRKPLRLVIFEEADKVQAVFIVADGMHIYRKHKSVAPGVITLLATYYVFNLEYPKIYSQLLGMLKNQPLQNKPFTGKNVLNTVTSWLF